MHPNNNQIKRTRMVAKNTHIKASYACVTAHKEEYKAAASAVINITYHLSKQARDSVVLLIAAK